MHLVYHHLDLRLMMPNVRFHHLTTHRFFRLGQRKHLNMIGYYA